MKQNPLGRIVYISIPETMNASFGKLHLDPQILLPVEIPEGEEEWNLQNLSWEMIISAMLKICAYQRNHKDIEYFRSFIREVKPYIVEELSAAGIEKAKNKEFDLAEEIFMALDGFIPENGKVVLNLALVYEQRSDAYKQVEKNELSETYERLAYETYKKALTVDPSLPEVHYHAAFFYAKLGNIDKAKEHFKAYVQLENDDKKRKGVERVLSELDAQTTLDTMFKEAYDFIRLGKEEEGIQKILFFLKTYPDVWNAWFLLGWGYRRIKQYGEGKKAFLKALELEPQHTDTLNELAICLMELGEFKEARTYLEHALRAEPENTKIISNLGILSLKQKKENEAAGFFRTVLEIEPDDPIAKKYLEFIEKHMY